MKTVRLKRFTILFVFCENLLDQVPFCLILSVILFYNSLPLPWLHVLGNIDFSRRNKELKKLLRP